MKKLLPVLFFGLLSLLMVPIKSAATEYVDCVQVSRSGILSYSLPEYEIKIINTCSADLGTVYLDFDIGGYSSNITVPRISIWSAIQWENSKIISLRGIKPGYYNPTVKVTTDKDYSWKRVKLSSFSILNPSTSDPNSNAPKPVQTPLPATIPTSTKCEKIDTTEIQVSLNDSLKLMQMAKSISTGYDPEINLLVNSAEKIKIDANKEVCATGSADIDSKLNLAKVTQLADVVAKINKLIVEMTNLVLIIQKTPNKSKTTITCQKGKLVKKVSGITPVCPTGYRLKV